ncbi:hypothetical protein MSG28_002615 [Choristoneura fumiferana]|uniref:Uncharacterized protein n=1 Tax=Choristoneura fumiferana TaxID=7141 RepID=A0ACC0JIK7_CHOFU|nr:hypothetical protein MSG28_002615 [Choristoneura fumiferana]
MSKRLYDGFDSVEKCFVAGVILRERIPAFERMLWRACRGNVFLRQAEIDTPLEDPSSSDQVYKSVFIIFFQGDQLKTRVKKICEGFRATLYPCPEAPADRREMAMGVMTRIEDLNTVLGQTQDHRHRVLVAAAKNIKNWFVKVRKIKAIYHTLNLFNLDVTQKCLIAECWVPALDLETIQLALRRGTERSGSSVPPILNRMETAEDPPTYNRTNKFTSAFQNLIYAYGVATYREVNPAPYTIITFPFLFAVMFGDLGHGALMAAFGFWMCYKEKPLQAKKIDSEIWTIFFGGRYIILLMGLFSMYTGLIYNDIFSKSLNIFGSAWRSNYNLSTLQSNAVLQLNPDSPDYLQQPYPFGIDPVWQLAEANKIIFMNAYKMKISIIIGVFHMLFGVCMSLWNHLYFKRRISIYVEFVPQIAFLTLLFFYMVLLMFIKWTHYGPNPGNFGSQESARSQVLALLPAMRSLNYGPNPGNFGSQESGTRAATCYALSELRAQPGKLRQPGEFVKQSAYCAPSILITFINMMLFKHDENPRPECDDTMFAGQMTIQKLFVILALLCIPVMLFGKPYFIMQEQKRRARAGHQSIAGTAENGQAAGAVVAAPAHHDEEISEVFIHQAIHTIEYVLGSISHTASYLRLWALSLAHAQLAEVAWNMLLRKGYWGWMSSLGPGELVAIGGRMNSERYLEVLKDVMLPSVRVAYPEGQIYLVHDNSSVHKSKIVKDWLNSQKEITVFEWPAKSPDLNPIENLWGQMVLNWDSSEIRSKKNLDNEVNKTWELLRNRLMSTGFGGGIFLYVVFAGWAAISVSILVLMEGLSAFLHTLRLHWVEFQSKFYAGEGYLFQPFSFEIILESAEQGEE